MNLVGWAILIQSKKQVSGLRKDSKSQVEFQVRLLKLIFGFVDFFTDHLPQGLP